VDQATLLAGDIWTLECFPAGSRPWQFLQPDQANPFHPSTASLGSPEAPADPAQPRCFQTHNLSPWWIEPHLNPSRPTRFPRSTLLSLFRVNTFLETLLCL
ncbi:hypothetical protein XENORESO_008323, partial [Xenotaenia resolanae]